MIPFIDYITSLLDFLPQVERRDIAFWIAEETTGLSRSEIIGGKSTKNIPNIEKIIARLRAGEPIQYIFGHTLWRGLDLLVNPSVLIPRQETAELVDWVAADIASSAIVSDLGTGSGCIAIALKTTLPNITVTAIDFSDEVLNIAKQNAERNGADIHLLKADILRDSLPAADVVVSNPPYIALSEQADMESTVLDYEPHYALFVPDEDPLLYYRTIMQKCRNAQIYFEINPLYANQLVDLGRVEGYADITIKRDMCGKDRFIRMRL